MLSQIYFQAWPFCTSLYVTVVLGRSNRDDTISVSYVDLKKFIDILFKFHLGIETLNDVKKLKKIS